MEKHSFHKRIWALFSLLIVFRVCVCVGGGGGGGGEGANRRVFHLFVYTVTKSLYVRNIVKAEVKWLCW